MYHILEKTSTSCTTIVVVNNLIGKKPNIMEAGGRSQSSHCTERERDRTFHKPRKPVELNSYKHRAEEKRFILKAKL